MSDVFCASECTLRGALPLVLAVSRVLGVAPVRLTRVPGGRWNARVASRLLVYSYLHVCVFSVYSFLSLILKFQFSINLSLKVYDFGDILWLLNVIQLVGTVTVGVYGVQARMEAVISSLNTVEPILEHYQSAKLLRRLYIKESILILACSTRVLFDIFRWFIFYSTDSTGEIDIWKIVLPGYLYLYCLSSLLLGQFALPALRVTAALQAMNHSLRDLLFLSDLQMKRLKSDVCGSVRHLSTCFEAVHRAAIGLNDSFGFILALNYGFLLIFITVIPYRLIVLHVKEDVGHFYAMGEALDLCTYFLCILVGVQPGHEIEREVICMRCTVSELLSHVASRIVQGEHEEIGKKGERKERGKRRKCVEWGEQGERSGQLNDAETLAFMLSVFSKQLSVTDLCFAPLMSFKLSRRLVPMLLTISVTLTLIVIEIKGLE